MRISRQVSRVRLEFIFDKYADEVNKYTVKKLCQTTRMDVFEAFSCMILLIEEPDEALKLLQKDAK